MFITRKSLPRRTFLRGMGATVALPLLDSMIPASTALATTAANPVPRAAFIYFPHGAVMSEWTPVATAGGKLAGIGQILVPLAEFTERLTVMSDLANPNAAGPVHLLTPGTWLRAGSAHGARQPAGTLDQIVARTIGRAAPLKSIQLATEPCRSIAAGAWEGELDRSLGRTISFDESGFALPMEDSPRSLFDKLFGTPRTAVEQLTGAHSSILDSVSQDTTRLLNRLGPADRVALHTYLDKIRSVELRVHGAEAQSRCQVEASVNAETLFVDRLQLMFDMIALAFQADITRVASFMMAAEASDMTYRHLGLDESFHELSHHRNDPLRLAQLVKIQNFHTRQFAAFVRQLAEMTEGDASVLDRSVIVYGSNMSDSYRHDHYPLPLAIVGGCGGRSRAGRHLRNPDRTPMSSALRTLLDEAGVCGEPSAARGDGRTEV